MKAILTVKIDSVSLIRRTCTCCDEKAYVEITAGTENEKSKQTQSMVLCKEHAKQLKMFLPE